MKRDFQETIATMIAEQGDLWLAVDDFENRSDDHNAVIVTDGPDHCYRLVFRDGRWLILQDRMTSSEAAEFFAAFGSHWIVVLSSWIEAGVSSGSELVPIRAFIKNGRKRGGFSISIDIAKTVAQKAA